MRLDVFNGCKFSEYDPILFIGILRIWFPIMNINQSWCEKRPWNIVNCINKPHWSVLTRDSSDEIKKHLETSLWRVIFCISRKFVWHCLINRRRFLNNLWGRWQLLLMLWNCRCYCSSLVSNTFNRFLSWGRRLCLHIIIWLLELLSWRVLLILKIWYLLGVRFRLWLFVLFIHGFLWDSLSSHLQFGLKQ